MLVLTRKASEVLVIPSLNISVAVASINGSRVRLAISAPPEIAIHRKEVLQRDNPGPQPDIVEAPAEGVRVLIAESDVSLAQSFEVHLVRLGYEVSTAVDGLSCAARLREQTPHLLVLDVGLLWGRAEGVLALLEEYTGIPVLASHAGADDAALSAVRPFDVSEFIAKPLTPERLVARIDELLASG